MSDNQTKALFKNEKVTNLDGVIATVDLVEADSNKREGKRVKFIRVTSDTGKTYSWFPYYRLTIPELEKQLEEQQTVQDEATAK